MAGFKRFLFLIDADLADGSVDWIQNNSADFLRGFPLQDGKGYLLAKNQILFFNKLPDGSAVKLSVQPINQPEENIMRLHQQLSENAEPKSYPIEELSFITKGVKAFGSYEAHTPSEIRYELLKSSAKQVNFSQRELSVEDSKALVSHLDITPLNLNEVDVSVSDFQKQIEKTGKAVLIDISAYKNLLDKIKSIGSPEVFNSDALESLKENKVKLEEYIEKANSHNKLANLINLDLSNFEGAILSLRALVTNVDTSIEEQLKKKKEIEIPPQLEQLGYSQSVVSEYTEPLRRQSRIRELNRHFELLESFESLNQEKANLRVLINNHNKLVEIHADISTKMNGWKENPKDNELREYIKELKVIRGSRDIASSYMDFSSHKDTVNFFIEEIKNLAKEAETKLDNIMFSKNISDVKNALDEFPDSENLLNVSLQEVKEKINEINILKSRLQTIKEDAQKIGQSCKDVKTQIYRVQDMSRKLEEVKNLKEKEVIFEKLSSNQPYLTEYEIDKFLKEIDDFRSSLSMFEKNSLNGKIDELRGEFESKLGQAKIEQKIFNVISDIKWIKSNNSKALVTGFDDLESSLQVLRFDQEKKISEKEREFNQLNEKFSRLSKDQEQFSFLINIIESKGASVVGIQEDKECIAKISGYESEPENKDLFENSIEIANGVLQRKIFGNTGVENKESVAEEVSKDGEAENERNLVEEFSESEENESQENQHVSINGRIKIFITEIEEVQKTFDNIKGLSPIELKKGVSSQIFDSMKADLNELKTKLGEIKDKSESSEIKQQKLKGVLSKYVSITREKISILKAHSEFKRSNKVVDLFNNFIYKIKVNINKKYKSSLRLFKVSPEAGKEEKNEKYVPKRQQRLEAGNYAIAKFSIFKQPGCERKDEVVKSGNAPAAPAA